jgi:hypothetical protein
MVAVETVDFPGPAGAAARQGKVRSGRLSEALDCVATAAGELRSLFSRGAAETLLAVVQNQADVEIFFARRPGKFDRVAAFPAKPQANDLTALSRKLGRVPASKAVLRVASNRVIRKVVWLPSSALGFLPGIVRNKVEGLAPWQTADMLWGYRLVDGSAAAASIAVEIGMTASEPVEALMSSLKAAGIDAGRIELGDGASSSDRIAVSSTAPEKSRRGTRKVFVVGAVLGALALAAGLTGGVEAWMAQNELRSVGDAVEEMRAMSVARSAAGARDPEFSTALAVAARKQHDVPFIMVLKDLTQAVSDGIWLQSIDFAGGRLTITGKGGPAPPLIAVLENLPQLKDVKFAAATERSPDESQDSFSISATVGRTEGEK